jgi:hypothetical protein
VIVEMRPIVSPRSRGVNRSAVRAGAAVGTALAEVTDP